MKGWHSMGQRVQGRALKRNVRQGGAQVMQHSMAQLVGNGWARDGRRVVGKSGMTEWLSAEC
jgi:hypothetical protein